MRLLVDKGADKEMLDKNGRGGLFYAVLSGNTNLVALILAWNPANRSPATLSALPSSTPPCHILPASIPMIFTHPLHLSQPAQKYYRNLLGFGNSPFSSNVLTYAPRTTPQSCTRSFRRTKPNGRQESSIRTRSTFENLLALVPSARNLNLLPSQ